MSILVVGSIALDTVETPFGEAEEALGGAAVYFSYAASFFNEVRLVGVVGDDFPEEHLELLAGRNIDLAGLERAPGATFRWKGRYDYDLNEAHTLDTQLNVFETFAPSIPDAFKDSEFVFLANIQPGLQLDVARQVDSPKVIACDTMNFWIEGAYDQLRETLKSVDILVINDAETRELAREPSLVKAARQILEWGPETARGCLRSHRRRRHLRGRLHGLPVSGRRDQRSLDQAGDSLRLHPGFVQRGGFQPQPDEEPGDEGYQRTFHRIQVAVSLRGDRNIVSCVKGTEPG
jgi:sugar/nucleoside kinase (ribokinase family)